MERETAELLDKILIYLDTKDIREKWLDILTYLEIDVEHGKELLKLLKLKKYIIERNYTASTKRFVYIVSERKHPFFQKILLTKMILSHMGLFRFNSGANFSIKKLKLPIC